jgi:threonine/homoserine/homoserine lactone efflux protein
MLTNLLNPKVALFFLALMPQFIDATSSRKVLAFLALGATFITTGTTWNLCLAISAGRLRRMLISHPALGGWISRAAGAAFVALGVRLALSRR